MNKTFTNYAETLISENALIAQDNRSKLDQVRLAKQHMLNSKSMWKRVYERRLKEDDEKRAGEERVDAGEQQMARAVAEAWEREKLEEKRKKREASESVKRENVEVAEEKLLKGVGQAWEEKK